jgi:hypothetical protein
MQLIPAVGGYITVSLPGKGPSGQQLDPDISLAGLVGSTASLLTVMCGACIAKPHPDVAGSPVYLRWSSISAVILSYASMFQGVECLPQSQQHCCWQQQRCKWQQDICGRQHSRLQLRQQRRQQRPQEQQKYPDGQHSTSCPSDQQYPAGTAGAWRNTNLDKCCMCGLGAGQPATSCHPCITPRAACFSGV